MTLIPWFWKKKDVEHKALERIVEKPFRLAKLMKETEELILKNHRVFFGPMSHDKKRDKPRLRG